MKSIIIFILGLIVIPAFASDWPTFSYPGKEQLLNLNYLDTKTCPKGEVRLSANASINIKLNNCKGFCPDDWTWKAKSDGTCHKLSDIHFKGYQINHAHYEYDCPAYDWDDSTVTAIYGPKNSNEIFFKFEVKTTDYEYWYCVVDKADPNLITCANDI